ncbi:MAG: M3 family oligoendopeptidase [Patescibacteria group bacterium]
MVNTHKKNARTKASLTTGSSKMAVKTAWDLSLFYASTNDPRIETDIVALEKLCADFAKKYSTSIKKLSDPVFLKTALGEYEALCADISGTKPLMYLYYCKTLDGTNRVVSAMINRLTERVTFAHNQILFFDLALGALSQKDKDTLLADKSLSHFHYFLFRLFEASKHQLTLPEEKILNLKSQPAYDLWVSSVEKLLSVEEIEWKGKSIPLGEAQFMLSSLATRDRALLQKKLNTVYKRIAPAAEAELNAIVINHKINDLLRGFSKPYSGVVLGHQNDEAMVETLVSNVTKHFDISQRFYAIKAKLLGLKKLTWADRAAPLGTVSKKFTFADSVQILRKAFGDLDPEFKAILDRFLANGQIDVYPKKGKEGGAFCSGSTGVPTMVFLNHIDTENSLLTFAHEMGHAIHTELSKKQTPFYDGYTTPNAEVASTFFENFAFDAVFKTLSKKEQLVALHDRINDSVSTIFRQIACFNFEHALHMGIREKGELAKEDIAKLLNTHMSAYLGPQVTLTPDDGYFFVSWGHIRRFFYVYSYAYGELVSKALYRKYIADPKYLSVVKSFLSAGGSKSPKDIWAEAGIDITDPQFFIDGLRAIEDDILTLESLYKSSSKK